MVKFRRRGITRLIKQSQHAYDGDEQKHLEAKLLQRFLMLGRQMEKAWLESNIPLREKLSARKLAFVDTISTSNLKQCELESVL